MRLRSTDHMQVPDLRLYPWTLKFFLCYMNERTKYLFTVETRFKSHHNPSHDCLHLYFDPFLLEMPIPFRKDVKIFANGRRSCTDSGSVRPLSLSIVNDCVLAGTRRVDIMTAISYLEHGYEKLSRWTSSEFRRIGHEMLIEVTLTSQEAIRRLRKHPELLTCVLPILD
jgi:hypothetical protein